MSENSPLLKDLNGEILIVEIYFKTNTDNRQNDARRWLKKTLPKALSSHGELRPLRYALLKYIQEYASSKAAGKAIGGEYTYIIEKADSSFLIELFTFLEDRKKSGEPNWLGDYYIYLAEVITQDMVNQNGRRECSRY